MAMSLRGKVVVITGASAGIGREAARLFARSGARVVISARRADRLEEVCRDIATAGGVCLAIQADVTDRGQVLRLLHVTLEQFGRVDVWINNAGSGLAGSIEQTTPEEMMQLWEVNFMGTFHGCQVAVRQMRRQGGGHIINVSSLAGRFSLPLHGAYTATKHAVNGLSEALALELVGSGIYVSTIMPGVTETEFTRAMIKKIPDTPIRNAGRTATAREVAAGIVRCARRPRPVVMYLPAARLTLAFCDLFPGFVRAVMRKYIRMRTAGRGVPIPGDNDERGPGHDARA